VGMNGKDNGQVRHPYYLVAPPYRETSSGVRVLHQLCHELRSKGCEAYVTTDIIAADLDTPFLTEEIRLAHRDAGLEPIAVYPEIVLGNPIQTKVVSRYILNKPGFLSGSEKFNSSELLFTYSVDDFMPDGMQADLLCAPAFDINKFNNFNNKNENHRSGRYYFANRFVTLGGVVDPEIKAMATPLEMDKPKTLAELAEIFRSAECLYSYEMSAICTEAMLCGCPVVYLPNPGMPKLPCLEFFSDSGAAWGNTPAQFEHAKQTVHMVWDHYQAMLERFDSQLDNFIKKTQHAAEHVHSQLKNLTISSNLVPQVTRRQLPVELSTEKLPPAGDRIRVGVLSGDVIDGACMRLRLHDGFNLLSPWLDTIYFPGNAIHDCRPEAVDIDKLVDWAELFVVQRGTFSDRNALFMAKLFASGKPMIFELDDWLPAMPTSHHQYQEFDPSNLWRVWQDQLHLFTAVTVSTEEIAAHLRPLHSNIYVMPNALLASRYKNLKAPAKKEGDAVTIGFAGTSTHVGDMRMINQALLNIQQKFGPHQVNFVFWGCVPQGFEGAANVRVVSQGVSYTEYLNHLNRLGLDIAIAPLEETLFNQGKSDLKWLEYTAVGAASVLSDVLPYQEAKELGLALVVGNDCKSWERALTLLIEDASVRNELVEKSRLYLQRYATLESQCYRWIGVLKENLPLSRAKLLNGYSPEWQSRQMAGDLLLMGPDKYRAWLNWNKKHELREIDAEMMAERMLLKWQQQPQFLLVMTARAKDATLLVNTIDALQQQLYKRWKLVVVADWEMPDPIFTENDTLGWLQLETLDDPQLLSMALNGLLGEVPADWIMLLPAGAMPAPQLLLRMGDTIQAQPQALAIYADHDSYTQPECRVLPQLKPDFSLDFLRAQDYVGAAVALSYQGLASLGGFEAYPGCEVWNHLLRLAENYGLGAVQHIDELLMHLPAQALGVQHEREAARQVALENHLQRLGIAATVSNGYVDNTLHVEYQVSGTPLVSVIVPTRDKMEYLQPCVESLLTRTAYRQFELLIIDNGSQDPDTFRFYQDLQQDYPQQVRIIDYPHTFNFSAQCNLGVEQAQGEYIVLLNNDTEIIQPEWMDRMIGIAQRPEVGAVGIRLVYPESGCVQHAGIVLGLPGGVLSVADHVFEKSELDTPGYMNRLLTEQNYSAVTAACLMVSKQKYQAVGGFDAESLTVLFNDVDFCLKLQQQGLLNVFTPYITMVHHHAKSIGKLTYEPAVALAAAVREQQELSVVLKRWLPQLANDPAYNRHLSLRTKDMAFEPVRDVNWLPRQAGRSKVLGLPIPGGSGEYRVSLPFHALQESGRLDVAMISPEKGAAPLLSVVEMARFNPDALLIHTMLTDGVLHAVKQYREYLPDLRLVFGLDDLVGALPEKSILHRVWRKTMPDARPRLRAMLKHFDTLVVSTEPLAEACRDMIDDIRVVPNRLARHMWGKVSSLRGQGRKPRVGWVGAQQHQGDLALILDVVKQTADEVEWVFMGMCLPEMRPYIAEEHPCVSFQDYPEKMASLNLDLAIAPLEINPFNESKSNLRLLEYGVMGWPVICTDIYPYQTNDAPVCRVPNDTAAWVNAIRARIHDLESAYREGDALRAWVDRHYWLEDHLEDWQQGLIGGIVKK